MKINVNNTEKIQTVLDKVQEKASVRMYDAGDIARLSVVAEQELDDLEMPICLRKNAKYIAGYRVFPNSYRFNPQGTIITLERGTKDWFLVDCIRDGCNRGLSNNGLKLTEEQKDYLKEQIDIKY